jgi:hypothetical protein
VIHPMTQQVILPILASASNQWTLWIVPKCICQNALYHWGTFPPDFESSSLINASILI